MLVAGVWDRRQFFPVERYQLGGREKAASSVSRIMLAISLPTDRHFVEIKCIQRTGRSRDNDDLADVLDGVGP